MGGPADDVAGQGRFTDAQVGVIIRALAFAAERHRNQRRKGKDHLPYINHLIGVMRILWDVGEVRDPATLVAALLHDTVEDTDTTPDEIEARFGGEVASIVREVTDDKSLPKDVRKQLQIVHAADASAPAKLVKLADKVYNVRELSTDPPAAWPTSRIAAYVDWAEQVVARIRGTNAELEAAFDAAARETRASLVHH